jgi:Flp pilus assembly protein TadB
MNAFLTYVLLAGISGLGIFFAVAAFAPFANRSGAVGRAAGLREQSEQVDKVEHDPRMGVSAFIRAVPKQGLARTLYQADLQVTPVQFLRLGLLLGLLASAALYALVGAVLTSLYGGLVAFLLYMRWLFQKRDTFYLEYETALADICDRMAAGAQRSNTIDGALLHAAAMAPEILKEDFEYIASARSQQATVTEAFKPIMDQRQSTSLNLMAASLNLWKEDSNLPLGAVLAPLSQTIRRNATRRQKVAAELSGRRNQMLIVAAAPIFFVALLRFSSPDFARIYGSMTGEVLQIVAYTISLAGVLMGERALARVNRIMDIAQED